MHGDLTIRKVRTSSGATAVQIVRYVNRKCIVLRHMGSARTDEEFQILWQEAEFVREKLCFQPALFPKKRDETKLLYEEHLNCRQSPICLPIKCSGDAVRSVVWESCIRFTRTWLS